MCDLIFPNSESNLERKEMKAGINLVELPSLCPSSAYYLRKSVTFEMINFFLLPSGFLSSNFGAPGIFLGI